MAADIKLTSSLDDDVTFERMRCPSNKASLYSAHKQLSWKNEKIVKQFERDRDLATVSLSREKSSMMDRLAKLKEAQKKIQSRRHSDPNACLRNFRRQSEPCLKLQGMTAMSSHTENKHQNEAAARNEGQLPSTCRRFYARRNTVAEGMADSGSSIEQWVRGLAVKTHGLTKRNSSRSSLEDGQE